MAFEIQTARIVDIYEGYAFTRGSTAYDSRGRRYWPNNARFESVGFGQAITIEEGATNLCTANQSDVETDTTGFLALGTATITRSTADHFTGSASLKVDTKAESISGVRLNPSPISNDGFTKTLQVRIKGAAGVVVAVQCSNGLIYHTLTGGWDLVPVIAPSSASTIIAVFTGYGSSPQQATTFYLDTIMVAKQPYRTTWHIGGSTRDPETLTVLKDGAYTDAAGSLERYIYLLRAPGTSEQYIFDGGGGANENLVVYIATDGKPMLVYGTGAAERTITSSGDALEKETAYKVRWEWSAAGVTLEIDDVEVGSDETAPGLALAATGYWGCKADGTKQLDGLMSWNGPSDQRPARVIRL